jgi:hypothetical protein
MVLFRFILFFLILINYRFSSAQIISVDKDNHHYGQIEWGSSAICYFTITNTGSDELIIFDIEYNKYYIRKISYSGLGESIAVGDSVLLKIEYNTKRTGTFNTDIHIIYNSDLLVDGLGGEKVISVTGRVISPMPILTIVIDFTIIIILYIGDIRFSL